MFMCMSKARRLCMKCPPSLRVLLFKAYVMPILTYGCEVITYNVKHVDSMNKLIIKYARWATGLPPHACTNAVLREAGLRPVQYDFLQAPMDLCFSVQSKEKRRFTRLVLAYI